MISDSNGRSLRPQQLMPGGTVTATERFTVEEAINGVPEHNDPARVTDVIFQVGLNDHRKRTYDPRIGTEKERETIEKKKIQDKYVDMLFKYNNRFPNARMHITALPPISNTHEAINDMLQTLGDNTGTNFIPTKAFLDNNDGLLRSECMKDDYHYNEYGVKVLAKAIKKSLYSDKNIGNNQLSHLNKLWTDRGSTTE